MQLLFNVADLETFNSVLLLIDYHSLPQTIMFWETEDDIELPIVYEAMSWKEFEDFKSFIHFVDNNAPDTNVKFTKVRSFYRLMIKSFKQFGFFHTFFFIDEQTISYTARRSSKQQSEQRAFTFDTK